jgi:hypothetical protein
MRAQRGAQADIERAFELDPDLRALVAEGSTYVSLDPERAIDLTRVPCRSHPAMPTRTGPAE